MSPVNDGRCKSIPTSTLCGPSDASISETTSSNGGSSPRGDEHPAAAWQRKVLSLKLAPSVLSYGDGDSSPDSSPKRSRRRRQRVVGQQTDTRTPFQGPDNSAMIASPYGRQRVVNQKDTLNFPASESPVRGRSHKEMLAESTTPIAASSSPVRARVGPRGIMGTDASAYRQAQLAPTGDASNRCGGIMSMNGMRAYRCHRVVVTLLLECRQLMPRLVCQSGPSRCNSSFQQCLAA